jgi:hypothetical protein
MTKSVPAAPIPPEMDGVTIHNRLKAGHPYASIDEAFRTALRGLPGQWDVSVYPIGRTWFRIDVLSPDGASWSMSVPAHDGPRPEELADAVRAACARRRLRPKAVVQGAVGQPSLPVPEGKKK